MVPYLTLCYKTSTLTSTKIEKEDFFLLNQLSYLPIHLVTLISPPPVKPEGTIGLHSVCLSVSLSVSLSVRHTSFRTITDSVIHL